MKRLSRLLLLLVASCGSQTAVTPPPAPAPAVLAPDLPAEPSAPTRAEIIAASDLPQPLPQPLPGDAMGVTIHRLENGLTVYISTDRLKPRITARIAVRAGSRHDPADSTGLAHYLEHMLFKGTEELGTIDHAAEQPHVAKVEQLYADLRKETDAAKRKAILGAIDSETQAIAKTAVPNELDRLYDQLGVLGVNAFTNNDMTVYVTDVPSNRLEAWATVEASRYQHPVFRLFYPELEAVYEEKNRTLDSPGSRVYETMARLLFPHHPYGTQTTIGEVEHLKSPAYGDMVAFFHRWYLPNNVAIILAGDVDPATALPILESTFGSWEPRPLEAPAPGEVVPLKGRVAAEVKGEGETTLSLSWITVPAGHPDEIVLDVLTALVGNQTAGLLQIDLLLPQKLPSARAGGYHLREAGVWGLSAVAREGQSLDEVEQLLLGEVEALKQGRFTDEDLAAIILQEEKSQKYELESNPQRASAMLQSWAYHIPWEQTANRMERLRKVTRADVIRAAHQYLGGDFAVVRRLDEKFAVPKIEKPTITPVPIDSTRQSALAKRVLAMPATELQPVWLEEGKDYQRVRLPSGTLLAAKNPRNDLFYVTWEIEVGERREPLLCYALELFDRSGAGDLSAEQLRRRLFSLGTTVLTYCGPDESGITVQGLDRNFEQSMALVDQWLRKPRFDDELIKGLLRNEMSSRKDSTQNPRSLAGALAGYAARGRESGYLLVPTNRMLARATGAKLTALLAALPDFKQRTLYFGPRDAADAGKVVLLGKRHRVTPRRPSLRYRAAQKPIVYFLHKERAQAQINVIWARPPVTRDQRALSTLLGEYMGGGMGALVFQEIREARGLAYSVHANYHDGLHAGDASALFGDIGTQADKTVDAVTTFLDLLRNLPRQPERFEAAKLALDRSYRASRVDPRSVVYLVAGWDDLGEESDPRRYEQAKIASLTLDDVTAFAAAVTKGPPILAVLGDRGRIDMDALGKIATVDEVTVEQLFSYGAFPAE